MAALFILAAVFVLIAVRQVGTLKLQIWQIMLLGAVAALLTGQISPTDALRSINLDVMLFLFGMFVVGQALEDSGYLYHLTFALFRRARSLDALLLTVLFGMGLLSALLMNDTLAIVGTPVVLFLARKHGIQAKVLLLALAYAVTIGSVMSPIGNPQNLLIAMGGGISNPFITFVEFLFVPTVVNLLASYVLLRLLYKAHFNGEKLSHSPGPIADPRLSLLSKVSLAVVVGLIGAKVALVFLGLPYDFRLTYIALLAALPILAFSPSRWAIVRKVDWPTLVFFAAMFVLMESVWRTGVFQSLISRLESSLLSTVAILGVSIGLSQLISNVPLVALYLPVLVHAGASTKELMALAAGSTIAGNLLILGAASNVIIIHNAERRSGESISFMEFARVGALLTLLNAGSYWLFLALV